MNLSFIHTDDNGIIKVVVAPTGKCAKDCRTGAKYARELASYITATDNRPLFARVVRDMSADKSGIGVGFLFELALIVSESA